MVNDKQFVISGLQISITDWQCILLANGYFLYYQKRLNVVANHNNSVVIIGDAWQTDPDRDEPAVEIMKFNPGGVCSR